MAILARLGKFTRAARLNLEIPLLFVATWKIHSEKLEKGLPAISALTTGSFKVLSIEVKRVTARYVCQHSNDMPNKKKSQVYICRINPYLRIKLDPRSHPLFFWQAGDGPSSLWHPYSVF